MLWSTESVLRKLFAVLHLLHHFVHQFMHCGAMLLANIVHGLISDATAVANKVDGFWEKYR